MVRPERLAELRQARLEKLGTRAWGYADLDHVKQEIAYSYLVYERRKDWPLVDVTTKPIEEAAAEVVALLGKQSEEIDSQNW